MWVSVAATPRPLARLADTAQLERLEGHRARRRAVTLESTPVAEVNFAAQHAPFDQWRTSYARNDAARPPPRRPVGGILRQKHQIMYLAQEASARAPELANHWAQARASRQGARNKYGF